jgi:hypothetical protein
MSDGLVNDSGTPGVSHRQLPRATTTVLLRLAFAGPDGVHRCARGEPIPVESVPLETGFRPGEDPGRDEQSCHLLDGGHRTDKHQQSPSITSALRRGTSRAAGPSVREQPFSVSAPGPPHRREHGDAAKYLKQWFGDADALVLSSSSVEAVEDRGMSRSNARTARCATGRSIGWICCARDFDPIRRAFPSGRERPPASLITSQGLTPQRGGDDRCQTSVLTWDGTRVNTPRLNRSCSCAI